MKKVLSALLFAGLWLNLFSVSIESAKLVHEIYYDWLSSSSSWEDGPQIKNYVYDVNGDLEAWEFGFYYPETDSMYIDQSSTYQCTYYTDYYQLRNYVYSTYSSNEDRYRYSLDGKFLARYKTDIYYVGLDWIKYVTDKIYNYVDGKINYVFDHYVEENLKKASDEAFITYYYYDGENKLTAQNYHEYYSGNMLERTNWTYFDSLSTAEAATEIKESELWVNKSKKVQYFDENSQLRKEERFNWSDSLWTENETDSIYYYDGGLIRQKIIFKYNTDITAYEPLDRIDYIYDDETLGIEDRPTEISDFRLYQNFPNPFNPVTSISYALPNSAQVELSVYNLNGQLVKELVSGKQEKGIHKAEFEAADITSGMYIYNLKVDGKTVQSKKMMLLK